MICGYRPQYCNSIGTNLSRSRASLSLRDTSAIILIASETFDVDTDGGSDTLFFETDQDTNYPELMVLITKLRPDEFDQQTPNCFRMWFD